MNLDKLQALKCVTCNKHGVYFSCNVTGDSYCKNCWIKHKTKERHNCAEQ